MKPIDPERLVELAADPDALPTSDERARLASDSGLARELAEWRGVVRAATSSIEQALRPSHERTARLAEVVLRASTRSGSGASNGWASLWDAVVRPRSLVVRVVAVSLLLHLAALPVIAWFVHRAAREGPRIVFEPPMDDPFDAAEPAGRERDVQVDAVDSLELLDPDAAIRLDPTDVDNARRRSRHILHGARGPDLTGREASTLVGRILVARSRGLAGDWSALPEPAEAQGDRVAAAILAESYLDRAVLTGKVDRLREALTALFPRSGELARWAAARAYAYGWSDADLLAEWSFETWVDPLANPFGDPFAPEWGTRLARAVDSNDPVVEAWSEWALR